MSSDSRFRLTRRDFLKLAGALAGTGLMVACQQDENVAAFSGERWAFCLHDYQLQDVWDFDHIYRTYPKEKAVPETVTTFRKDKFVPLTPEWQWFWYRNLIYCAFGHFDESKLSKRETEDMHAAWWGLIKGSRVVTNRHGRETHWEVITGRSKNVGKEYIAHDGLLAGGNIIKITGDVLRKGGQVLYPFESLDGSKPPPDINEVNVETRPDLLHRATISHFEQLEDGSFRVDPFPQLEGYNAHTLILNISTDQNYVPANRIVFLEDICKPPNPYNPAREMNYANNKDFLLSDDPVCAVETPFINRDGVEVDTGGPVEGP
jgi:hypothetical protein